VLARPGDRAGQVCGQLDRAHRPDPHGGQRLGQQQAPVPPGGPAGGPGLGGDGAGMGTPV